MPSQTPDRQNISRRPRLLRGAQVAALAAAGLLLALILFRHEVDQFVISAPSGQLRFHCGQGKLVGLTRSEPGPWGVDGELGENPHEANGASSYFWPRAGFDALGLEYVSGTWCATPFTGKAIGVSYWYGVLLFLMLFGLCWRESRRLRRANQELNCGQCVVCGAWVSDPRRPGHIPELRTGAGVDGRPRCLRHQA